MEAPKAEEAKPQQEPPAASTEPASTAAPEQPPQPQPQPQPEPQVDIFEQFITLTDQEKNLCPEKVFEFVISLYTKGLLYKLKENGVKHVPISLYPSPIPRGLFDKIFFYQIVLDKLLYKLSNDQKYLEEILTPIASKDNFVQKLLEISKKSVNFEKKQKIRLGIFRNDYLLDKAQDFIFLQDWNTSSVGFNSYTNNLLCFHNYFDQKYPDVFAKYKNKEKENTKEIPQDKGNTIENFSHSIVEALKLAFPETKEYLIVFVIKKDEQAKYDFELENLINGLKDEKDDKIKIKIVKLSLGEISKKLTKDGDGNLLLDGNKVSMVYFNTGDKEEDYPDEDSWNGRELVELSTAIKVPDVNILLASLRIFQYYLTKPGIIMHYYDNALIINDILRFFGGIYYAPDLEKEKQTELFNKIQAEPNKYILKPFHGNKNILTGEKLKGVVPAGEGEPSEELKNGIILEVSTPPEHEALIIRDEKTSIEKVISEYSIYGIILSNDNNLTTNKSVGYLVRTRNKENVNDYESSLGDEKGNIVLDLPCLVEKALKINLAHKYEVKQEEIQKYLDDKKAAEEEAKKKAEEEAKKKAEEEEAKKKAEEEAKKKAEEENNKKPEEATKEEGKKEGEKKEEGKKEEEKKEEAKKEEEKKEEGKKEEDTKKEEENKKKEEEEKKKKEEEEKKKKEEEEQKKKEEEEKKKKEEEDKAKAAAPEEKPKAEA